MSNCVACDAAPGECGHDGARYLEPIHLQEVAAMGDGRRGWQAPAQERWRIAHPPSTWSRLDPFALDYGSPNREQFPPVETDQGERVRQEGLRMLGGQLTKLAERSRRNLLTPIESAQFARLSRAVETLQAMAPA